MIANKLNIVKRAVKAAPLTYNEMDVNLNELINVITDVVDNRDAQDLINAEFQDANDVQDLALTAGLATKINTTSIVDALTSTDATKVLSAKQGKTLSDTVVANKSDADTKFADRYTKAQDDALLLLKVDKTAVIDVAHGGTGKSTPLLETGKAHISGLLMKYVTANTISVSPGRAYIPSTGAVLEVPATITTGALTLTASTFYHVYLYDNAGTPAIEVVTTAPVSYFGSASQKTGDATRRYVGSVLCSGTANVIRRFIQLEEDYIRYVGDLTTYAVASTSVLTPTVANCAIHVPPTARAAVVNMLNPGSSAIACVMNPDIGTLSSTLYQSHVYIKSQFVDEIELSAAKTFVWMHTVANDANFFAYVYGYRFLR